MILRVVAAYFWLSLLTLAALIFWPYYRGAVLPQQVYEAGMVAAFFSRIIAPYIAATTVLANALLLYFSTKRRFWIGVLILQMASCFCFAYLISRPTPEEVVERQRKQLYEKIKTQYVSALKKRDFVEAERIFSEAIARQESDLPNNAACIAADNASTEGLAFSIRLQHKFSKQLPQLSGLICRPATDAIIKVDVEKTRAAVESGDVLTFDNIAFIVQGRFWHSGSNTDRMPEERQLALLQIAIDHHFIEKNDWRLLAYMAVEEQEVSVLRKILQSAGGPAGLSDHGAQAIITAANYGWSAIDLLLSMGVDINEAGEDSHGAPASVLVAAVERNDASAELVASLLERGANVRAAKERAPLAISLDRCNIPIARLLLAHGADPNASDPYQQHYSETPFSLALRCANADRADKSAQALVQDLLRHGADFARTHKQRAHRSSN